MKYKVPSNRKQIKFLKKLMNTKTNYNGGFVLTDKFYSNFKLSKTQINQILMALSDKELVSMMPPNENCRYFFVRVEQKAFSYIPDFQDYLFRFWLPIVVSAALSIAALIVSIYALSLSLNNQTTQSAMYSIKSIPQAL